MKKCPFCGEKLDDNARFCLYCMKPLEEKEKIVPAQDNSKRRLILVISAALALAVLIVILFLCLRACGDDSQNKGRTKSDSPLNTNININVSGAGNPTGNTDSAESSPTPTVGNNSTTDTANETAGLTTHTNTYVPSATVTPDSTEKVGSTVSVTNDPQKTPVSTASPVKTDAPSNTVSHTATTTTSAGPIATPEVIEDVTWYYYDTTGSSSEGFLIDMYSDVNIDNAITICGFKNIASNGIYKIPDTIDGKVVVAINMAAGVSQGYTFSSTDVIDTVKKVYLPPRLIVVSSESTFTRCPNITDLYVASDKLHIAKNFFPYYYDYKNATKNSFTFHSSESCIALYKDRYTTFKSLIGSGSYYNGKFNTWDKSEQY